MLKIQKYVLGSFGTNCYFIIDSNNNCIIVDPGCDFDTIKSKIAEKNLIPKAILLTHAHFDHIMALEECKNLYDIPVYCHELENEILSDSNKNMLSIYKPEFQCKSADYLIKDNDEINILNEPIIVIHTPGHTPGSVCYIFDNIMISGDTIFYENIGRYDFYGGNYRQILSSIQKIAQMDIDYKIYPGHGPSTSLLHEKKSNFYFQ